MEREQWVWIRAQLGLLRKAFVTRAAAWHTARDTPPPLAGESHLLAAAGGVTLGFSPIASKRSPALTATFLQPKALHASCTLEGHQHLPLNCEALFYMKILFSSV